MKRISFFAVALATTFTAITTLLPTGTHAETGNRYCAERGALIQQLQSQHGERRRSAGLQQDAGIIETYANAETGTWTIILTLPTGVACLVAVGENWREDQALPNKPEKAA